MAKIKTACGCVLQAGFTLKNKVLAQDESVVFRTVLATETGALAVREVMTADGTGNTTDTHLTLSYNLADKKVIAGNYAWELLFTDAQGRAFCLVPAEDGKLTVSDRITMQGDAV